MSNKETTKIYTQDEIIKNLKYIERLLSSLTAFGSLNLIDYELICAAIEKRFNYDISKVEE
ncbi:hypothetical protein ACMC56_13240 [Campylobacterota bacterium DY0563]